jgi:hypothetical protein
MTTSLDLGLTPAAKPRRNWRRGVGLAILILLSLTAALAGVRRIGRVLPRRGPSLSQAELPASRPPFGPFGQFGGSPGPSHEGGQPFSVPELGIFFVISKDGLIVTNIVSTPDPPTV